MSTDDGDTYHFFFEMLQYLIQLKSLEGFLIPVNSLTNKYWLHIYLELNDYRFARHIAVIH